MHYPVFVLSAALAIFGGYCQALAAPQTTYEFKADKTPFEGPNAQRNALRTIVDSGFSCNAVTALAFVKSKNNVKIFKAQCDARKWYVLLQSPEGQMKALDWDGAGEPH